MREPLHLTLYRPESQRGEAARVLETPLEAATPKGQAIRRNELCLTGWTQGLVAYTPGHWRAKLGRSLIFGFVCGLLIASCVAWLIPG